jgi:hypothetical protein
MNIPKLSAAKYHWTLMDTGSPTRNRFLYHTTSSSLGVQECDYSNFPLVDSTSKWIFLDAALLQHPWETGGVSSDQNTQDIWDGEGRGVLHIVTSPSLIAGVIMLRYTYEYWCNTGVNYLGTTKNSIYNTPAIWSSKCNCLFYLYKSFWRSWLWFYSTDASLTTSRNVTGITGPFSGSATPTHSSRLFLSMERTIMTLNMIPAVCIDFITT